MKKNAKNNFLLRQERSYQKSIKDSLAVKVIGSLLIAREHVRLYKTRQVIRDGRPAIEYTIGRAPDFLPETILAFEDPPASSPDPWSRIKNFLKGLIYN